jgi:hypothetical protein
MFVEGNMAHFRNELGDKANEAFPLTEDKKKKKDREKAWLDDPQFMEIVMAKGELFSRMVKGWEQEEDHERLTEVTREIYKTRQRLRKAFFSQKLEEVLGDVRTTWGVLGRCWVGYKKKMA